MSAGAKLLGAYWLLGCVLMGGVAGHGLRNCPAGSGPTMRETATAIAIWPAVVVGAVVLGWNNPNLPEPTCERAEGR